MDSIKRAIERGMGKGNESQLEELYYEGYAPGGVAVIIEAATDNRNRTASEVRAAFTKIGGNLGESGSVSYMFELKGLAVVDLSASGVSADDATMIAIDAGADDVVDNGDTLDVYTDFKQLITVRTKLIEAKLTVTSVEKTMRPKTLMQAEATEALKALKLIDKLDDLDDVQKVYSNLDITDELAEQFSNA
jgi:YebC/PmpR family DNA-binding regulatory protein